MTPDGPPCVGCIVHAQHEALVVFNRVPKCGSSSLEAVIKRQASHSGRQRFSFERSRDFTNNSLSDIDQRRVAETVTAMARQRRVLYDRHILYINFAHFRLPKPVYINLIRDPVKMQISAFYFWRQCVCVTRADFCAAAWKLRGARDEQQLCDSRYTIDATYDQIASAKPLVKTNCSSAHQMRFW